ncbi:MAG: hypothetical protein V2B20_02805 [Pseudomonadota bacterium]
MSGSTIACICGQSGSAMGLVPVIRSVVDLHGWESSVLTYGEATAVFKSEGIRATACSNIGLSVSEASSWLKEQNPLVILLGSDASRHVEKSFIRAAAGLRIPTIMYIDYWSNYERRFTDLVGMAVPDRVAVIDECMATDIMAVGVSSARICIVGSPALENVSKAVASVDSLHRKNMRIANNVSDDSICILFLSSPDSELDFGDKPLLEKRQHSLFAVLNDVAKILADIGRSISSKIHLIVRPHPREATSSFQEVDAGGIQFTVSSQSTSFEALCIADLVVGLDTIMLIEAILAKKVVISIGYVRPLNKAIKSLMALNGAFVSSRSELSAVLTRYLTGERCAQDTINMSLADKAIHQMVELVLELSSHDSLGATIHGKIGN